MRIGVDIDGVLSRTFERWQELCAAEGLHFEIDDIQADETGKVVAMGDAPFEEVLAIMEKSEDLDLSYKPYTGARVVLSLLAEHDLYLITGRGDWREGLIENTHAWLDQHGIPHKEVHFTPKKLERCQELGIGVIIEDDASWSLELAEGGVKVLLFDKPYNRHLEHGNITRFTHWAEVPRLLSRVAPR